MENEERVDLFEYYKKDGKHSLASLYLLPSLMLNPKITDWDNLKRFGYLNLFLYDKTEGFAKYYPNSLLIIMNPSKSFRYEHWEDFSNIMKSYNNFICENYYDDYVYGYWMKINAIFGQDLRILFKQGKYSEFPKNYLTFLSENQKKVCNKDKTYQKNLEIRLGLKDGELDNCELDSKDSVENYTFRYIKHEKINNI